MAALGTDVFEAHTPIILGRLANGPASAVNRTARESAIPAKYFYTGIRYRAELRGDAGAFRVACPTAVVLEANVRCAFSTLVEAGVADAQVAHNAAAGTAGGGTGFDAGVARTAAAANVTNRAEAIALGSVHTALVLSYEITDLMLNPTERSAAKLILTAPAAAADEDGYIARARTATGGWTVTLASGNVSGAVTDEDNVMLQMAALSSTEVELGFAFITIGQASPVRAGCQLFVDAHHYKSEAAGNARHVAIEKEVMARASAAVQALWRQNIMMFRNIVWWASIHPVLVAILLGWAEDQDMPSRLDATGIGSMSVGLPAEEDLFRRAGSYKAVYNQVYQTATRQGHTLSIANMTSTVTALANLPRRGALDPNRPALPGKPAAPWPAGCNTRAKALKLFLEPALDLAEPVAAWMFGFYKEICARAGIRKSSPEGSLLRSYSLSRAVANYIGEANRAQEMYSAYVRQIRAAADDGRLESYTGQA